MSLVDLSRRQTNSYEQFQRFSCSSDSLVFIQNLAHSGDLPASIDLSVGEYWFDCREEALFEIPADGIELLPRMSAVIQTNERLALPKNVYGLLSGKGTLIFQGVIVSPGKIDPGFDDHLKIGIFNAGPKSVRLNRGVPFCSCSFLQMESQVIAPRHHAPAAIPRRAQMRRSLRIKRFLQAEWQKPPVNLVSILTVALSLIALFVAIFMRGK